MNKEKYETPEMEVIVFETEDVITTSGERSRGIGGVNDLLDDLLFPKTGN